MKEFDVKVLVEILKDKGLDIAEDAAKIVVESTLGWAVQSAKESENKYDDLLLVVIEPLRDIIMQQVDKIDGEEG